MRTSINPAKQKGVEEALKELQRGTISEIIQKEYEIRKKRNFGKDNLRHLNEDETLKILLASEDATPDANIVSPVNLRNAHEAVFVWTPTKSDRAMYSIRDPHRG